MSDELRELRLGKKLPAKEIVAVVQRMYPSFDKTMLSKSENGDKYGVSIRRDALNALIDEFAPEERKAIEHQRNGRHKLTRRISCRLPDDVADELLQQIQADGYKTTQDWLDGVVKKYLASKRNPQL